MQCPETGNAFLPHRDNCNAFFACSAVNRQQTLLNCAPGLHFDFERQLCDLPRTARCWARENPPIPGQPIDQGPVDPIDPVYPPFASRPGQLAPGMQGPALPPMNWRPRAVDTDVNAETTAVPVIIPDGSIEN